VIVSDFDMYTKKDPMAKGEDAYERHTSDGEDNVIFNGVPDWVYEGESVISVFDLLFFVLDLILREGGKAKDGDLQYAQCGTTIPATTAAQGMGVK
jgi:hypothetical protein